MDARQPFSWTSSQTFSAHSRSVSSFGLPHSLVMPISNVRSSACDGADQLADEAQQAPPTVDDSFCTSSGESRYQQDYDDIYCDLESSPELEYAMHYPQPQSPPDMSQSDASTHSRSSSFGALEDLIPDSSPEPPLLYLTEEYKALAECFSPWLAHYLWISLDGPQRCVLIISLHAHSEHARRYGPAPATNLATGIRDVLCVCSRLLLLLYSRLLQGGQQCCSPGPSSLRCGT